MEKTLEKHLNEVKAQKKALVVPYIMAGDGGLEGLEAKLLFLQKNGVSAIEVGIPFSDPVADGPIIQAAGLRALEAKTSLHDIVSTLTTSKVEIPLVIMSYFNPILNYGLNEFIEDLAATPVKGLIIPDLPYEHRDYLEPLLKESDIALVPLLSLTSPRARMKEIAQQAEGFIYAVTVNGTTGVRSEFGANIDEHLKYLTSVSPVPVLAGFGVSTRGHVEKFAQDCDGVIIGSKIVALLAEGETEKLEQLFKEVTTVSI